MNDAKDATSFPLRLASRRRHLGLSQRQLAEQARVSLRSVQNWEAGTNVPQDAMMRNLSETLQCSLAYLMGSEPQDLPPSPQGDFKKFDPIPVRQSTARQVPVISWASAGGGGNYPDAEGFLDERVNTTCSDVNAYALIVENDSMEPKIQPGDRVIVAPNLEPRNGDTVIARLHEDGTVLIKGFQCFGPNLQSVRLVSYNQVYPPLEFERKQFRFIHPVWEITRRLRT